MIKQDVTGIIAELQIAERALQMFCETYGLGWNDAHLAATYEAEQGRENTSRALRLVSRRGCTWLDAIESVESANSFLLAA